MLIFFFGINVNFSVNNLKVLLRPQIFALSRSSDFSTAATQPSSTHHKSLVLFFTPCLSLIIDDFVDYVFLCFAP